MRKTTGGGGGEWGERLGGTALGGRGEEREREGGRERQRHRDRERQREAGVKVMKLVVHRPASIVCDGVDESNACGGKYSP